MEYLEVRNWEKFQHYKDRNPPWIKLHQDLMTSDSWVLSSDSDKLLMIGFMLLAARTNNNIPADTKYIQRVLHLENTPNIQFLLDIGFVKINAEKVENKSPWPSRYISESLRNEVLTVGNYHCRACGMTENLEIDHIIPVSKGGESKIDNLQVLCRSCNRRKRVYVADATQNYNQRSLEKETDTDKKEKNTKKENSPPEGFENFWEEYPRQRRGNREKAEAAYRQALKRSPAEEILVGLKSYLDSDEVKKGFAKGATAWLNDDRWQCDYSPKLAANCNRTLKNVVQL